MTSATSATASASCALLAVVIAIAACDRDRVPPAPPPPPVRRDAAIDLDALHDRMVELEDSGDVEAAREIAKQIVDEQRARKQTTTRPFAEALTDYGRLLDQTGKWAEAESALQEGLNVPATDGALRSTLLFHLGSVHAEQRRNELAVRELEESLKLSVETYGDSSQPALRTSEALAAAYDYVGDYAKAETLFRRVLTAYEAANEPVDLSRAQMNLALNLEYQKRPADALVFYRKAEATLAPVKGRDRQQLAETYAGIARVQRGEKKLRAAEASFRKALATRIEALGAEHPLIAMDYYNLAVVLDEEGRTKDALAACEKSEGIRKATLETDHPHRVETEQLCDELRRRGKR